MTIAMLLSRGSRGRETRENRHRWYAGQSVGVGFEGLRQQTLICAEVVGLLAEVVELDANLSAGEQTTSIKGID